MAYLSDNSKSFVSGCVSGWTQVLVMQPFQIIKLRQINEADNSVRYHGFIRSAQTIYKQQGLSAFYKGTKSPLVGFGLLCSLQFGFNRLFRKISAKIEGKQTTLSLFIASVLTGIPSAVIVTPTDHLRILMQKQTHHTSQNYKNQLAAIKNIIPKHGIRGLFLGFNATLLRQLCAMGVFFTSYQQMRKLMQYEHYGDIYQKPKIMIAGGLAGLFSWIVPYPIDFVKSKMQSQDLDQREFKSSWECFRTTLRAKGWKYFTRGLVTVSIRSIPVNSMAFLIEQQMGVLLGRAHVHEW